MRFLLILFLTVIFLGVQLFGKGTIFFQEGSETILALGFLIISGYLIAKIVSPWKLPKISGYILAGILFGPYILGFFNDTTIGGLKIFNALALNIIAFTAGGELNIRKIRKGKKAISLVILFRFLIVFICIIGLVLFLSPWISFFKSRSLETLLGMALLFAIIEVSKSPATTIAVITETEAKGPVTDLVLSVTVVIDVLVLIVFAFILSYARILLVPGIGFDFGYLFEVLWDVFGGILIGMLLGIGVIIYIRFIKKELVLFLISLAFISAKIGSMTHTDTILICLMAGFVVENFSSQGRSFIRAIEKGSLIIYVIFFVIAGASLNFNALAKTWYFALLIIFFRLLATYVSTWLGGVLAKEHSAITKYAWTGFIGQAGVSLGLALVVQRKIPGEIGVFITTIVFASIAINQMIGPIIFKWGLLKSGEIKNKLG